MLNFQVCTSTSPSGAYFLDDYMMILKRNLHMGRVTPPMSVGKIFEISLYIDCFSVLYIFAPNRRRCASG